MKNLFSSLFVAAIAAVTFASCGSSRIASEDSLANLKKYMQPTEQVVADASEDEEDTFTEVADSDIVIIDDDAPEAPKAESKAVAAPAPKAEAKAEDTLGDRVDQSYRLAKHDTEFPKDKVTNCVGNNPKEQEVGSVRKTGVTLGVSVGYFQSNEIKTPTLGLNISADSRIWRFDFAGEFGKGTEPEWSDRNNKSYLMSDFSASASLYAFKAKSVWIYVGVYGDVLHNKNLKKENVSSSSTEETSTQIINRQTTGSSYYSADAWTVGGGLTLGLVKKPFFSTFEWGVSAKIGVQKAFRITGDVYRAAGEIKFTFSKRIAKRIWNDHAVELSEQSKQKLIQLNKERAAKQK